MPPIGETLREARMRQRIDVQEVETRTKIRAKYIRALENEEFDLLPGPTFVRSFLRTYAEFLGLDSHLLIEEYRRGHEPIEEADVQPLASAPPRRRRRERQVYDARQPGRGMVVAVLAVVLIAFLAVLGLTGGGDEDGGDENGAASTTDTERAERAERRRRRAARRRAEERRRRAAARRRVVFRLSAQSPTYACIENGEGGQIFEGTVQAGNSITRRARTVRVNLGNRSGQVTVNGRRVQLPAGPNPIGYEFTPRGRRELPVGQRPDCAGA
jgi:cytoskeletal protein RodZ